MAVDGVRTVAWIQIRPSGKTWSNPGYIGRPGSVDRIIKDFIFVFVGVSVKLSGNRRLEAIYDFSKFSTEDGPTVLIARWNMTEDMHLK